MNLQNSPQGVGTEKHLNTCSKNLVHARTFCRADI